MPTVLYVDDSPQMLRAVKRQLEAKGWSVTTAAAPRSAEGFDAVLADWEPSGPAMVRECWGESWPDCVPVVVYTGNPANVDQGLTVVEKPATSEQLSEALFHEMRRVAA